ncbi:arylsulfatase [Salpingoeca rosetta]|uniref:Arylsulfatase n=1 Tax=Salpingoeca rosetta (strain ATCC 50818 / BSB-021) TaxID=946362 RepID=F2UBC7_SALR5|nr:arylsulfatase [Salpingoeca rosetta]EGD73793.1 arylsulfatase [Salpingoeca rosetta]|eukprot:XP_004993356.1 arylsulfatase [Salpingoeca rosetta]
MTMMMVRPMLVVVLVCVMAGLDKGIRAAGVAGNGDKQLNHHPQDHHDNHADAGDSKVAAHGLRGKENKMRRHPPPHIVYFLVDDLGYANTGVTNDEPLTPHIDELARNGTMLRRFYTYKYCSPTRSSLLSGRLPIHVNQENRPPPVPGGGIDQNMTTLAEVLQRAGYATHQVGKWHCGMSSPDRLPVHRGFNSSFGYLSGAEHHYSQIRQGYVDLWRDTQPAYGENGTYGTFMYAREAERIIHAHDPTTPLFLYLAFQNVHSPLEVPDRFLDKYPDVDYRPRKHCLAMVSAVDEAINNVTLALRRAGLFDDTLIIFSSDNGGPHDHANNYPFRGAKTADFEGGVRAVAFVSGGVVPKNMVGTNVHGLMHVCDWYSTLARLAGEDPTDHRAARSNLPPIDGFDMWPMLTGANSTSPRVDVPLSGGIPVAASALISGQYKLVRGKQPYGFYPGVHMPNSTDDGSNSSVVCDPGCVFDLQADETEHVDLARERPQLLRQLLARAAAYDATYYQTPGDNRGDPAAKAAAKGPYHGYWGPWQPPGPLPPPSPSPPLPPPAPAQGVFFATATSGLCLRAVDNSSTAEVQAGACDGLAKWTMDGDHGGALSNPAAAMAEMSYLVPHRLSECQIGDPMMMWKLKKGDEGGVVFREQNGTLAVTACEGMCVGVVSPWGGGAVPVDVAMVDCTSPLALLWEEKQHVA